MSRSQSTRLLFSRHKVSTGFNGNLWALCFKCRPNMKPHLKSLDLTPDSRTCFYHQAIRLLTSEFNFPLHIYNLPVCVLS